MQCGRLLFGCIGKAGSTRSKLCEEEPLKSSVPFLLVQAPGKLEGQYLNTSVSPHDNRRHAFTLHLKLVPHSFNLWRCRHYCSLYCSPTSPITAINSVNTRTAMLLLLIGFVEEDPEGTFYTFVRGVSREMRRNGGSCEVKAAYLKKLSTIAHRGSTYYLSLVPRSPVAAFVLLGLVNITLTLILTPASMANAVESVNILNIFSIRQVSGRKEAEESKGGAFPWSYRKTQSMWMYAHKLNIVSRPTNYILLFAPPLNTLSPWARSETTTSNRSSASAAWKRWLHKYF